MSGRLDPLNSQERTVLAALCALEDAGEPPTTIAVARRLPIDPGNAYTATVGLRRKGWVEDGPLLRDGHRILRVLVRPMNVEKQRGYRAETLSESPGHHPDDVPAMRDCLSCRRPFQSEGWHDRMCPGCGKKTGDGLWMGEVGAP